MVLQAKRILKDVFGYDEFRSLQEAVIQNILSKKDSLVIMPTGGGKSLCYQIPALIFPGITLVISPLISLMKDQVGQLEELGIPTTVINSSLSYDEYVQNMGRIRRNEVKLVYMAPETLMKPKILEMLESLAVPVDCITIDEAHCISEWGHDFRPEYRQIAEVRKRFSGAVCVALTATATQRVREDIKNTLNFSSSNEFIASFDRKNLFLRVIPKQNPRIQLLKFLEKFKDQPGIVYCFSRRQVDELTMFLASKGFSVSPYHAGLSDEERRVNQDMFIRDNVQIIVATIAFGMGINKSNIRFVVHYDLPKNIESYYQEIGRSGRDGLRADCLLLFGYGDIQKIKYFIDQKEDENEQRIANIHLNALLRFAETDICRRIPLLNYFGEQYHQEDCRMCDNCLLDESDLTDITIPAQKFLVTVRKTKEIFGAGHISDILRGSKSQKISKFNHNDLSTYGIGKDISKKQWFNLSRQFIQKGLLEQDMEYGSLKLTPQAYKVLKGLETVKGIMIEEPELESKPAKRKSLGQLLDKYDSRLFDLLKRKRKELADQANLPPYFIFSDRTLMQMAVTFPRTRKEFLAVQGVGGQKLQNYGDTFMGLITEYCHSNGIESAPVYENDNDVNDLPLEQDSGRSFPRAKKRRFEEVGELFNSGVGIEEMVEQYGVRMDTVLTHLIRYIDAGHSLRADGILSVSKLTPAEQAEVMEMFTSGVRRLTPVFEAMKGKVSYTELRLMLLYYLSCES